MQGGDGGRVDGVSGRRSGGRVAAVSPVTARFVQRDRAGVLLALPLILPCGSGVDGDGVGV